MKDKRLFLVLPFIWTLIILMLVSCGQQFRKSDNQAQINDTVFKYTMNTLYIETAGKGEDGLIAANFNYFCERFNIEFEFWPVTWTDWTEKTRIWIFSGDMPDILFFDTSPARFNEYSRASKQGGFKAFPDFTPDYPNLQKYIESLASTKYLRINGVLYTLPRSRGSSEFNNASYWHYLYRRDWAETLGLAKEDNIYNWDEWLELNRTFIEKDPGENGEGKTIGMGGPKWTIPKFMGGGCINPYFGTFAKQNNKYVWGPTMPESLDLVKTFKKMYTDGIIWEGVLAGKGLDSENKYYAGLMGAMPFNANINNLDNIRKNFKRNNPDIYNVKEATQMALVRDKNGKIYTDQTEDYWSCISFSPALDEEKYKRILTAYDWLASDEGYNFRTLGIKGLDWEMKNGETIIKWDKKADGTYKYPYPVEGEIWMGLELKDGFDLHSPAFSESLRKEVFDIQRRKTELDSNMLKFDYDIMYFSGPEYDKVGFMEMEIVEKLCELLINSNNIERDWKLWLRQMEGKYKPVEEELNRVLEKD